MDAGGRAIALRRPSGIEKLFGKYYTSSLRRASLKCEIAAILIVTIQPCLVSTL